METTAVKRATAAKDCARNVCIGMLCKRFEAELEQLIAARERRRHEEHSWHAQEERGGRCWPRRHRLAPGATLALLTATRRTRTLWPPSASGASESRARSGRAGYVRFIDKRPGAVQGRAQQRAEAYAAFTEGAGGASARAAASASAAAPLTEQVQQARLGECRCFAVGAEGHVLAPVRAEGRRSKRGYERKCGEMQRLRILLRYNSCSMLNNNYSTAWRHFLPEVSMSRAENPTYSLR